MTKFYNQMLPFIVISIVLGTIVIEQMYNIEIDLGEIAIILAPIGVAGAAKAAIERAGKMKSLIPANIKTIIDHEVNEVLRKHGYVKTE